MKKKLLVTIIIMLLITISFTGNILAATTNWNHILEETNGRTDDKVIENLVQRGILGLTEITDQDVTKLGDDREAYIKILYLALKGQNASLANSTSVWHDINREQYYNKAVQLSELKDLTESEIKEIKNLSTYVERLKNWEAATNAGEELGSDMTLTEEEKKENQEKIEQGAKDQADQNAEDAINSRNVGQLKPPDEERDVTSIQDPISDPSAYKPGDLQDADELFDLGGTIMGAINIIGIIIAVVTCMAIGVKYMLASPDEKADYKKTMIPYIIGAVFLFAGTSIINIIYQFVSNLSV